MKFGSGRKKKKLVKSAPDKKERQDAQRIDNARR